MPLSIQVDAQADLPAQGSSPLTSPSFHSVVKSVIGPASPLGADAVKSIPMKKMLAKAKAAKKRIKNLDSGPYAKSLSLLSGCTGSSIYFQLLDASWLKVLLWALVFFAVVVCACTALLCLVTSNDASSIATDETLDALDLSDFGALLVFSACNVMVLSYGPFLPTELDVLVVATALQMVGILINVFLFSIVVTKYQRPTAQLVFSTHAIFTRRHGQPFFLFRIANRRCNLLYHPAFTVTLVEHVQTPEGESFMRPLPLPLDNEIAVVSGCITIAHRITPESPLWKYTTSSSATNSQRQHSNGHSEVCVREADVPSDFYVSVTAQAHDSVYRSDIMASKRYRRTDLQFDMRFADVMEMDPVTHKLELNFKNFDKCVPITKTADGEEGGGGEHRKRSIAEFCF